MQDTQSLARALTEAVEEGARAERVRSLREADRSASDWSQASMSAAGLLRVLEAHYRDARHSPVVGDFERLADVIEAAAERVMPGV